MMAIEMYVQHMKRVKTLAWICLACLQICLSAEAENLDPNLERNYQREYSYLISQRAALLQQKQDSDLRFSKRLEKVKREVAHLQNQVAQLSVANDLAHEELLELDKKKKELMSRGYSLESTFKKSTQMINEFNRSLQFLTERSKENTSLPKPDLQLSDLDENFKRAAELLKSSARQETFTGTIIGENEQLQKAEITRLGKIAAFVKTQDGRLLLGPNGKGQLKVLEETKSPILYIFDNMSDIARVEKPGGLVETLAGLAPAAFLALMLMLVAGLFTVMVKI